MPCKCLKKKKLNTNSKSTNLEENKTAKLNKTKKIQLGQISYIQSINHGNHFNHMHEKAIKTQKTLTNQFSSYTKIQNLRKNGWNWIKKRNESGSRSRNWTWRTYWMHFQLKISVKKMCVTNTTPPKKKGKILFWFLNFAKDFFFSSLNFKNFIFRL